MSQSTATPLTVTCLAPRPFPFTAAIAAAGAFQYPTLRLLGYVFGARAVLFTLIGLPAIWFGRRILRMANSPEFTRLIVGFSVHIGHDVDHALNPPEPLTIGGVCRREIPAGQSEPDSVQR